MIRRIQNSEYLKRYDNMAAGERSAYEERVGEWNLQKAPLLTVKMDEPMARLQNVESASAAWNDTECQAFEDGVRLLTALVGKDDTWLPDLLYVLAARRVIRKVVTLLSGVVQENPKEGVMKDGAKEGKSADRKSKEDAAEETSKATQHVGVKAAVPVRPKHIDQYVHLLPKKTQEKAAQVQHLYRELDEAREKMRLLMDDETAKADDREAWAKTATRIDDKLKAIFREIDAEWDKLAEQGRVVVDDLGNARVVTEDGTVPAEQAESLETAGEEPAELTSEQKARRRELRKWLVDTRRGNGDSREEHVSKWKENFREFQQFDGEAVFEDQKILEAAAHYGIDLKEFGMKTEDTPAEAEQQAEPAEEQNTEEKPAEEDAPAEQEQPKQEKKPEAKKAPAKKTEKKSK